ncbi:MAG: exodeoxyribonuclease VII small subunit [Bacilli bacterium]
MKELKFEDALLSLEDIIKELENGEIDLDKSLEKYKEATELVKFCDNKLKNANETVNKILNENGKLEDFKKLEED